MKGQVLHRERAHLKVHSENKFVLAEEIKVTKKFQVHVGCP
mgnify:CR=1 FL=1